MKYVQQIIGQRQVKHERAWSLTEKGKRGRMVTVFTATWVPRKQLKYSSKPTLLAMPGEPVHGARERNRRMRRGDHLRG